MKRSIFGIAALAVALLFPGLAHAGEEQAEHEKAPTAVVRGVAAGGMSTASVFHLPTTGFHGEAGFSVDRGHLAVPIVLDLDLGSTHEGLHTGQVAISGGAQYRVGRFRIGGGLEAGYFWISRAQYQSSGRIGAGAFGIFALTSLDLVDLGGDRAIAISLRGEGVSLSGISFAHGTFAPRGSAAIGVRF
jgi:hypothetical protein